MITSKRFLLASACVALVVCAVWVYGHLEAYCFFYPAIDTKFAPKFSEQAFSQVVIGMSDTDVERLLGEPLSAVTNEAGVETRWFTADGKCTWGDFAWLGRSVSISNGVVVSIQRITYYD